MTEQKLAEERIANVQRLESVGFLAGGVAHDFNDLLTVINGYSELMLGKLSEMDPLRAPLEEIAKAGNRAAGLTAQLLAFSRKQVLEPHPAGPESGDRGDGHDVAAAGGRGHCGAPGIEQRVGPGTGQPQSDGTGGDEPGR